ncbi:MAG: phosphatidylserine/phosphatidylglycerophosphate/cardiolipin synthase family protein, partial [Gammaproteobacteria bacterium]|nr:phosphatidylserine/phosphatidylglycerophosphate/cardiolipin synthase family protein [Gammaproteobacteria bacterium]
GTILFPRLDDSRLPLAASTQGMDLHQWELDLDAMTHTQRTRGSVDLLIDGEEFFDRLVEEIADARESIRFRTYIFDNDDYALQIADLLKQRAQEIPVDILVDGLGTLGGGLIASSSLPEDFVAPDSIESYLEQDSDVNLRMLPNTWFMGDHTKTYLFDNTVAFLGGMNIGREYRYDWHDLMVELSGPVVDRLSYDDAKAAAQSKLGDLAFLKPIDRGNNRRGANNGAELRLLYTKPFNSQIYRAQLEAIRRSREYIYVQNAYLADDLVLYELVKARQRGVDVRVIIPSRPDSGLMDRSNVLATNILQRHGVRVFLYPGMTHVKAAIYDGWACFGTANFDTLSFKVNKEVNIATSDPQIVSELRRRVFEVDFAISEEITHSQPIYLADYVYEKIVDVLL